METLSCRILEVILSTHPEYRKEINNAARKIYRRATKDKIWSKAAEALILLARGDDSIAAKYAAEWETGKKSGEDLVYLAAVGTHFDCLQKVAPDLKKMEVTYAVGQN
ncbi:MAG: hypothetical protein IKE58_05835 [Blautia sp.]|nr:hypothetical protein [Blautia sp.]